MATPKPTHVVTLYRTSTYLGLSPLALVDMTGIHRLEVNGLEVQLANRE